MNEVNARRARSSGGYTISVTRSTQPFIPPGSLNRVPASAGVRRECHLCRVAGNRIYGEKKQFVKRVSFHKLLFSP